MRPGLRRAWPDRPGRSLFRPRLARVLGDGPMAGMSVSGMKVSGPSLLRAWLLGTTALLPAAGVATAQAPNARPTGGQVVAGSASIGQTATTTRITQTTNRAAIDWQGFNVGSQQS